MPNCSNCGHQLEDKPKVCPKCGLNPRPDSPGMMSSGTMEFLTTILVVGGIIFGASYWASSSSKLSELRSRRYLTAKSIATAISSYLDDNNDTSPPFTPETNFSKSLSRYLKDNVDIGAIGSYTWNTDLSGRNWATIGVTIRVWLFYTPPIGNDKIVVATAATNCKIRSETELEGIKKASTAELAAAKIKKP